MRPIASLSVILAVLCAASMAYAQLDEPKHQLSSPKYQSALNQLRKAVFAHWKVPPEPGNPLPPGLHVTIRIKLKRDGTLDGNPMVVAVTANLLTRPLVQTALDAVIAAAPYKFPPPEFYDDWKDLTLEFNSTDLLDQPPK